MIENNSQSVNKLVLNVGKDTLFYIPSKLFPAVFSFISLLIYTRIFPPSQYGDYSIVMATVSVIGIFSYVWINLSNIRFFTIYKNDNKMPEFFSTTFYTIAGVIVFISAAIVLLSYFSMLPGEIATYMILTIGTITAISFLETVLTILRAERNPKAISIFRTIAAMASMAVSLTLIYLFHFGISALFLGMILTYLAISAFILLRFHFLNYIHFKHFSNKTMLEFANFGVPLIVATLFYWVLLLSDRFIIEYFKGSAQVGIYSAAYQLGDYPITMFYSLVMLAAYPIIIDTWEKRGDQVTRDLISKISRYYLLLTVPTLAGIFVLSAEIMNVLGSQYADGYTVMPLICFGGLVFNLSDYINKGIELKKNTRVLVILAGVAAITNIAMNLVLVPMWGFFGAGIASSLAFTFYCVLSVLISKRYIEWNAPIDSIKNIVISSTIMGAAIWLLKGYFGNTYIDLAVLVTLGVIIYVVSNILLGELQYEIAFFDNIPYVKRFKSRVSRP